MQSLHQDGFVSRNSARGGEFLMIPKTAEWWLDYYSGLRGHLDARYRRVKADAAGVLYDLSGAADLARKRGAGASAKGGRR